MEFKGTKGEWAVNKEDGVRKNEYNIKYLTIDFVGDSSADCVDVYIGENNDEKQLHADANLIAAAPELLAFAIEMVNRYPNSSWIFKQGRDAVNKALGKH